MESKPSFFLGMIVTKHITTDPQLMFRKELFVDTQYLNASRLMLLTSKEYSTVFLGNIRHIFLLEKSKDM